MKHVRRILALVLVFAVGVSSMLFAANAETADTQTYPVIVVAGYGGTSLYKVSPDNPQDNVWYVGDTLITDAVVSHIPQILFGLLRLALGNPKPLADVVGREFVRLCGDLTYDEDGKPVTPLFRYHSTAEEVNTKYLNEEEDGKFIHEGEIMPYLTENLGEKAEEWTFNFTTDFRQNVICCARDLAYLVKGAKEFTGQEKVNLFAVSHGGQVTSTYLALCAIASKGGAQAAELAGQLELTVEELTELFDANDIHNAVITVPAIGGALLAYDVLTNELFFDEETLAHFLENGFMWETDYNWLVKAPWLGFLDGLLQNFQPYAMQVLGHWGSMWDFLQLKDYEAVKKIAASERFLRSDIIARSDYFHSEVLSRMPELLQTVEGMGVNVSIIAGGGSPAVSGSRESSDAIIPLSGATGAALAPFGQRFSNGYQTLNTQCDDPTHHHLSPAMDVDMSCGYLPESTWIVNGLFHGMTYKDIYTRTLMKLLIESDDKITVHDYSEYPQFHESMNVCESVYAEFGKSKTGFVNADDHTLTVKNLSKESKMVLLSVTTDNPNLRFDVKNVGKTLEPEESVTLPFTGTVQAKSLETMTVTVSYCLIGSPTPVNEKAFTFTLMNGEADRYNAAEPFTDAGTPAQQSQARLAKTAPGRMLNRLNTTYVLTLFWRISLRVLQLAFQR